MFTFLLAALCASEADAATLQVTTAADGIGINGSLRDRMDNAAAGDTIVFSTTAFPAGSVTPILVDPSAGALPTLQVAVNINGGGRVAVDGSLFAPGSGVDGLATNAANTRFANLEVRGFPGRGVVLDNADNSELDNLTVHGNDADGAWLGDSTAGTATGMTVQGGTYGLDGSGAVSGNCASAGGSCAGIWVAPDAHSATIDQAVVAGNVKAGILVRGQGATVSNCLVGTDAAGAAGLGNSGNGIVVSGPTATPTTGVSLTGNTVSGNGKNGILLSSGSLGVNMTGNEIGTVPGGTAALGNTLDGIRVFASDAHQLGSPGAGNGNLISGNSGSVVWIGGAVGGDYASDVVIENNLVGLDVTGAIGLGNGAYGVVMTGLEGNHAIGSLGGGRNVISDNAWGGVWVDAPDVSLVDNWIGTDALGLTAHGNGAGAGGNPQFGGVLVQAQLTQVGVGAPVNAGNLISGNTGHGVWLLDPGNGIVSQNSLTFNSIGVDSLMAALPNTGDGVRVEGAWVTDIGASGSNHIAGNSGHGVAVFGLNSGSTVFTDIVDNIIGDTGGVVGNGGDGIHIEQAASNMAVAWNLIDSNEIFGNGGEGIDIVGETLSNDITNNLIGDNGACAMQIAPEANLGIAAPLIESATPTEIDLAPRISDTGSATQIEVYTEPGGTEASVLVGITFGPPWTITGTNLPPMNEIRAFTRYTDGNTSRMTLVCGDGCITSEEDRSCWDGNPCTANYCNAGVCDLVTRPDGFRCDDGDPTTGVVVPGAPPAPDVCNTGVCQGGQAIVDPLVDCPFATECMNTAASPNECDYELMHFCQNGWGGPADICAVEDLDTLTGDDEDTCSPCAECAGLNDFDLDGIPDDWELNGFDKDCDGIIDTSIPFVQSGQTDILVEIDYMSLDCGDPTAHSHIPDSGTLTAIADRFLENGIRLWFVVDDCIPETHLISFGTPPSDIDCNDATVWGDANAWNVWVDFDDLKAQYFTKSRRGIYHYLVMGHGKVADAAQLATDIDNTDGICRGAAGGHAERFGDDFYVTGSALPPPFMGSGGGTDSVFHELGHNLGLTHGGPAFPGTNAAEASRENNYKPNYQSVMNYLYPELQTDDGTACTTVPAPPSCDPVYDYSREALPANATTSLDETVLAENDGIVASEPLYVVKWYLPTDTTSPTGQASLNAPIDWDGVDGISATAIELDLNQSGTTTELVGYDDWENLYLPFQCARQSTFADEAMMSEAERARRGLLLTPFNVGVDVVPGCAASPVPLDGVGDVWVAMLGDTQYSLVDVVPASLRLNGAAPRTMTEQDVDGDGDTDLLLMFRADDLEVGAGATGAYFQARLTDSRLLLGQPAITPVETYTDTDGDGVVDECDLCPGTKPGTPVGPDGCP